MSMKDASCIVFFAMFAMHVMGDWILQPQNMIDSKQKKWWDKHYPGDKHKKDYITACFIHGFFWSTLIHIPIIMFRQGYGHPEIWAILASGFAQGFVHMMIDYVNANRDEVISFSFDQWIHILQIIWAYIMCVTPFAFKDMFELFINAVSK